VLDFIRQWILCNVLLFLVLIFEAVTYSSTDIETNMLGIDVFSAKRFFWSL